MSYCNHLEAQFCVEIFKILNTLYPDRDWLNDFGVISPYAQQVKLIKKKFTDQIFEGERCVIDVNTVDGFQGSEKEVIVFSVVRASLELSSIGFVRDKRRMNVGITRPRRSLFVLGHAQVLQMNQLWEGFILQAQERKFAYQEVKEIRNHFVHALRRHKRQEMQNIIEKSCRDDVQKALDKKFPHVDFLRNTATLNEFDEDGAGAQSQTLKEYSAEEIRRLLFEKDEAAKYKDLEQQTEEEFNRELQAFLKKKSLMKGSSSKKAGGVAAKKSSSKLKGSCLETNSAVVGEDGSDINKNQGKEKMVNISKRTASVVAVAAANSEDKFSEDNMEDSENDGVFHKASLLDDSTDESDASSTASGFLSSDDLAESDDHKSDDRSGDVVATHSSSTNTKRDELATTKSNESPDWGRTRHSQLVDEHEAGRSGDDDPMDVDE